MLAVAHYLIGHLSYSQVPALAKRHKVEAKKDSASAQELLAKQVSAYDESELCKLLLEISLLDSAYQRSTASRDDVLMDAAKRYRVDAERLQKAVSKELTAKRDKEDEGQSKAEGPQKGGISQSPLEFLAECTFALRHFLIELEVGAAAPVPDLSGHIALRSLNTKPTCLRKSFTSSSDCFPQLIELFGLQIHAQGMLFELFNRAARVVIQCANKRIRRFQVSSSLRDANLPVLRVVPRVKLDYSIGIFFCDLRCKVRVEVQEALAEPRQTLLGSEELTANVLRQRHQVLLVTLMWFEDARHLVTRKLKLLVGQISVSGRVCCRSASRSRVLKVLAASPNAIAKAQ